MIFKCGPDPVDVIAARRLPDERLMYAKSKRG